MTTVAFIPARGGSKGVPGKNIRLFNGKPLIVHSIEQALVSKFVDRVFVSTDDEKIASISKKVGAEIIERPDKISGDTATSESAIEHGILEIEKISNDIDTVLFLQATSPLRPEKGIDNALEKFRAEKFDSLLSLSPTHRFFWKVKNNGAIAEYDFMNRPRRQDLKKENMKFVENGSLYIFTTDHFKSKGNRLGGKIGYVIFDEEYSYEIDSERDFEILEKIAVSIKNSEET